MSNRILFADHSFAGHREREIAGITRRKVVKVEKKAVDIIRARTGSTSFWAHACPGDHIVHDRTALRAACDCSELKHTKLFRKQRVVECLVNVLEELIDLLAIG